MNKPLYEALYFNLQAEITKLAGPLDHLLMHSEGMTPATAAELQEILVGLVQLKAARHELETLYKTPYQSPETSVISEQVTKAAADAQWEELMSKVNRIEMHLDPRAPTRTKSPTHEELLARSSSYRDSQGAIAMGTVVEAKEEFDEE